MDDTTIATVRRGWITTQQQADDGSQHKSKRRMDPNTKARAGWITIAKGRRITIARGWITTRQQEEDGSQ